MQKDPKFAKSQALKDVFQHLNLPNVTERNLNKKQCVKFENIGI